MPWERGLSHAACTLKELPSSFCSALDDLPQILCALFVVRKHAAMQLHKQTPRPGIEPGSSAWQAEILTTILPRNLERVGAIIHSNNNTRKAMVLLAVIFSALSLSIYLLTLAVSLSCWISFPHSHYHSPLCIYVYTCIHMPIDIRCSSFLPFVLPIFLCISLSLSLCVLVWIRMETCPHQDSNLRFYQTACGRCFLRWRAVGSDTQKSMRAAGR